MNFLHFLCCRFDILLIGFRCYWKCLNFLCKTSRFWTCRDICWREKTFCNSFLLLFMFKLFGTIFGLLTELENVKFLGTKLETTVHLSKSLFGRQLAFVLRSKNLLLPLFWWSEITNFPAKIGNLKQIVYFDLLQIQLNLLTLQNIRRIFKVLDFNLKNIWKLATNSFVFNSKELLLRRNQSYFKSLLLFQHFSQKQLNSEIESSNFWLSSLNYFYFRFIDSLSFLLSFNNFVSLIENEGIIWGFRFIFHNSFGPYKKLCIIEIVVDYVESCVILRWDALLSLSLLFLFFSLRVSVEFREIFSGFFADAIEQWLSTQNRLILCNKRKRKFTKSSCVRR